MNFGVVIQVKDLNQSRYFYRELLGLGEPVMDSSFLTVFEIAPGITLSLAVTAAEYLEHASAAMALRIAVPDVEAVQKRLELNGCPVKLVPELSGEGECFRGADPEGNPFYLVPQN